MEIRKYDYTEMNFMKLQGKCERVFPYIILSSSLYVIASVKRAVMEITLIWSEINTAGMYLRFYQKFHIELLRAINEDVVSESTAE